jgi:hypothetical protein
MVSSSLVLGERTIDNIQDPNVLRAKWPARFIVVLPSQKPTRKTHEKHVSSATKAGPIEEQKDA